MGGTRTKAAFLALAGLGCCLAIAGGASAGTGPSERIVGGDVANPADWPFMAAVVSRSGDQFCGASVVARRAVVTAAHCVVNPWSGEVRNREVRIVTGRPDLTDESEGQRIRVRNISAHRQYLKRGRHDIAILNLRRKAGVPAVLLPTVGESDEETEPGSELRVAGWGGTKPNGADPSDVLMDVALFAISDKECGTHFSFFQPSEEVCAFGEAQGGNHFDDSCFGDSGGPLIADSPRGALLVGIVSYGGPKCGVEKPGVYTQVSDNLGFVGRKADLP